MVSVALLFVGLRGYLRMRRRQNPTLSDLFIVLAWLAFMACCICDTRLNQLGLFAPGRTYEMKLTTVNSDPDKMVETLQVIPHFL